LPTGRWILAEIICLDPDFPVKRHQTCAEFGVLRVKIGCKRDSVLPAKKLLITTSTA